MRAAVGAAADTLAGLAALDASVVSDADLTALLVDCDVDFNRLDAARTALVGMFDARMVWATDAARNAQSWLAARTEQSRPEAAARVRLARSLRSMPHVAAAHASGRLGTAKARLLADAATDAPGTFAAHEALLVEEAEKLRVDSCSKMLNHWRAHANPDGAADRAAKLHNNRAVHLSQSFHGSWHLAGTLTPEAGEILNNALAERCHAMYLADKAHADTTGEPIARTPAQRRADALVELAQQLPAAGPATPSITATINLSTFCDPSTQAGATVGETQHGNPLSRAAGQYLTCDAAISRIVLDPDSTPIDLGVTTRTPTPAQRRALVLRDRGCVFPGCDTPPARAHAHHITHWADGGPTNLQNLALLCSYHHHQVHEGGYALTRHANGQLRFTKPDGTPLTVSKHPMTVSPTWPPLRR